MPKAKYQERTLQILDHISEAGSVTSEELAGEIDLSRSFAGSQLLKFYRRNWLNREPVDHNRGQPIYEYWLKPKGKTRLDFMKSVHDVMEEQGKDWDEAKRIHLEA